MRSPSSCNVILTVPCVDGCDGPIWISIGCVWRSSVSGGSVRPASIALLFPRLEPIRLLGRDLPAADERLALLLRIVLAQRVALKLLVEIDSSQIRVPLEDDAVHVVGLALEPVGAAPDRRQRCD